jgi:hypothetical protein
MKDLSPYWFLKEPVDVEHKYYVLMDFLQSVEEDLAEKKYCDPIQKITRIYNDLKSFDRTERLSDRTIRNLTREEVETVKDMTEKIRDKDEVEEIVKNSIERIDLFLTKITPYLREIEESISFSIFNERIFCKDRGYIVIRNNKDKKMRIYSWSFSIVKVDDVDQVGLLLSELIEPLPPYSKSSKKIYDFFNKEIKNFSKYSDCFIIADVEKSKSEKEISFELIKERSIEFIVDNYRKYISIF